MAVDTNLAAASASAARAAKSKQSAADKKKELRHFEAIGDIDAYGLEDDDTDMEPDSLGPTEKSMEQCEAIYKAVSSNMLFRNLQKCASQLPLKRLQHPHHPCATSPFFPVHPCLFSHIQSIEAPGSSDAAVLSELCMSSPLSPNDATKRRQMWR